MEDENTKTYTLCATRIKYLREENDMTLEEFGKIAGVGKSSVFRWEEGNIKNINTSSIKALSDHFNINPLWLLGYDVPRHRPTDKEDELQREISNLCFNLDEQQLKKVITFIKDFII